jgi:hypothetical protein
MASEQSAAALGPFRVSVDREREAAFRREIGFAPNEDGVAPACFPGVWLSMPDVHAIIARELSGEDVVPVHESQNFSYVAPLQVGESYELNVALRREQTPPRLVVEAQVVTLEGKMCVRIETMLRIVARGQFSAGVGV